MRRWPITLTARKKPINYELKISTNSLSIYRPLFVYVIFSVTVLSHAKVYRRPFSSVWRLPVCWAGGLCLTPVGPATKAFKKTGQIILAVIKTFSSYWKMIAYVVGRKGKWRGIGRRRDGTPAIRIAPLQPRRPLLCIIGSLESWWASLSSSEAPQRSLGIVGKLGRKKKKARGALLFPSSTARFLFFDYCYLYWDTRNS